MAKRDEAQEFGEKLPGNRRNIQIAGEMVNVSEKQALAYLDLLKRATASKAKVTPMGWVLTTILLGPLAIFLYRIALGIS